MTLGKLNPEKIGQEQLADLSIHLSEQVGKSKKVIFNSIIHAYF